MRRCVPGFTLIELLVVIIIIAVVAGILVPSYGKLQAHMAFDGVVADIQDIFAFAREQAISRDTTVTVSYDPQSEMFLAAAMPPPPSSDLPAAMATDMNSQQIPTELDRAIHLGSDYMIRAFTIGSNSTGSAGGSNSRTLRFRSDGTCDGAQLTVVSRDGYVANMVVMPATGQLVRVEDAGGRPGR